MKRIVGERVDVSARIFRDGHDALGAAVRYRPAGTTRWQEVPLEPLGNDHWSGSFTVDRPGTWSFRVGAWTDRTDAGRQYPGALSDMREPYTHDGVPITVDGIVHSIAPTEYGLVITISVIYFQR